MKNKIKYNLKNYDFLLVILLFSISVIGLMAIGSAKASVQSRQLEGLIAGLFIMVFISLFDYKWLLKFYWLYYFANLALLVLVWKMGDTTNNAQRWLTIFGIRFQPSESAKILLILFFAAFIMKHKEEINSIKNILSMILLVIPPLFLIYKQPDLSTTIMVCVIFCMILYIGGLSSKLIIGVIAVVIPIAIIALFFILQPDQNLIEPYQQQRILAWLQPDKYSLTTAYQTNNSITAIGSGQLWGKGLNNNEVGSVKNGNYISEPQTDFIFAIIGEEMGFIGGCTVIILEMLIALECFRMGRKASDIAGTIICFSMGTLVAFQSALNISVTTGLLPNTGIPLPFVSYGLTSLISLYFGMGFVLNVGLQRKESKSVAKTDDLAYLFDGADNDFF